MRTFVITSPQSSSTLRVEGIFRKRIAPPRCRDYHSSMLRVLVLLLLTVESLGAAQQPTTPPANPPSTANQQLPPDTPAFTDADGAALLHDFSASLEAHSLSRFLAMFAGDIYPRYPVFAGEMDSYFGRYDQFRVHYNLKQTTTDSAGRGILLAQMQLEAIPFGAGEAVRHSTEVRFELVRSRKRWKIAAFTPREFLS
jgi:hypothetical protein